MSTYIRYQHPVIEICRDCKGEGQRDFYHEYDVLMMHPEFKRCPTCEGSGRVVVSKNIEVTVVAFKTDI